MSHQTGPVKLRHHLIKLGALVVLLTPLSSCEVVDSHSIPNAGGFGLAQSDDRPLEERVDSDGDGEMSDDEIETFARGVLLDFSECMRDNDFVDFTDVVLEDFTDGGGGQGRFIALMAERGVTFDNPNTITALQACGTDLQDLQTFAPQPSDSELAEREEQLLEFAGCMRDQGLDTWPDPDFAANPGNGYGADLLREFDIRSEEVQDAGAACEAEGSGFRLDDDTAEDAAKDAADAESNDDDPDDATDESGETDAEQAQPSSGERSAISSLIESDTSDLNTATVTRRDLIQTKSLDGTLGYGQQRPLPTNTTGIVTALPAEGDTIAFGDVLFEVDNEPVLLLEGSIPQYRAFTINMDDGPDVHQLEQNLERFGWAVDVDLTIDEDFTGVTRDAIEALQAELGSEDTGQLRLGSVVFSEVPVRIAGINVELGQSITPQVTVLSVSESDQRISLDIDAEDRSLLSVGTAVEIEMPDGTSAAGSVTEVASVATRSVSAQGVGADPTIAVTVSFDGSVPDGVFDAAPVDIIVTDEVTNDVLSVPVAALVALSGGGHGVELLVEGGTQLISVELGDFVDDIVEVLGDIREGDQVVLATAG